MLKTDVTNKEVTSQNEVPKKEEEGGGIVGEEKEKIEVAEEKPEIEIKEEVALTCREFVEKIRREQFGVGIQFGEEEKKILDIHREREGRSLDRLSRELYTKDSHFVLELIQNADDNEYPETMVSKKTSIPNESSKDEKSMEVVESMEVDDSIMSSDEQPTVYFIVDKESVTVLNNEKGFTERNIKALCDIGRSTKGIHRKGYIGMQVAIILF